MLEANRCEGNSWYGIKFLNNARGTARRNICTDNIRGDIFVSKSAKPSIHENQGQVVHESDAESKQIGIVARAINGALIGAFILCIFGAMVGGVEGAVGAGITGVILGALVGALGWILGVTILVAIIIVIGVSSNAGGKA
jgi:hypothetical protein